MLWPGLQEQAMTQRFRMTVVVSDKLIGPLVELLSNEGSVISIVPEEQKEPRQSNGNFGYRHGIKNKLISAEELIFQTVPASRETLLKAFVSHKFAATTLSPSLSVLRQAGKVSQRSDGTWEKVK
jgi:hypothetical protein